MPINNIIVKWPQTSATYRYGKPRFGLAGERFWRRSQGGSGDIAFGAEDMLPFEDD